ncbi:MAG: glutaminase A [Acidimicrobiales bacterium]|nr:glutaminase A [Acidimicrobiales bacterium]
MTDGAEPGGFVSTGHLPTDDEVERLLADTYREVCELDEGAVSTVYPALARARPDLFGVALAGVDGRVVTAGDADVAFPIMSVAKPFVHALVCGAVGPDEARRLVGANATGLPFNAGEAVERSADGRTNPMVNAGAIATTSLVPGDGDGERWDRILDALSRFAGRELAVDEETYASATATNHRNRELVALLAARERVYCDPAVALDLYTRQSCVAVTARDLAVMGATLADGGVNPVTGEQVVSREVCHAVLAAMVTAGLYETSGDWLHDVGLPGKSGIGGGIVTVSPGKGGLGTFAPPLDGAGNSVKGQAVARLLSRRLGLDLLASVPHDPPPSE